MIAAIAGQEQIVIAIVVVVTNGYSLSIAQIGIQATASGHVGKGSVAVIVVESAMRTFRFWVVDFRFGIIGGAGLNQKDVLKAIVVVIEESAASGTELDVVELTGRAV